MKLRNRNFGYAFKANKKGWGKVADKELRQANRHGLSLTGFWSKTPLSSETKHYNCKHVLYLKCMIIGIVQQDMVYAPSFALCPMLSWGIVPSKYSCETTLINLVEGWREARDKHLFVSIMSTDMSRAFDSLHPPLLLSKLKAYGFHENVVELLKSYLSNRKHRVKMGSNISSNRFVNRGCPSRVHIGPSVVKCLPKRSVLSC